MRHLEKQGRIILDTGRPGIPRRSERRAGSGALVRGKHGDQMIPGLAFAPSFLNSAFHAPGSPRCPPKNEHPKKMKDARGAHFLTPRAFLNAGAGNGGVFNAPFGDVDAVLHRSDEPRGVT